MHPVSVNSIACNLAHLRRRSQSQSHHSQSQSCRATVRTVRSRLNRHRFPRRNHGELLIPSFTPAYSML
ncbi:Pentatricopeptide repeat-containing protein [Sesbania bispinosa]|nr:Pentatricopeptide repeat-containing protein [Sesbania bispinosa]